MLYICLFGDFSSWSYGIGIAQCWRPYDALYFVYFCHVCVIWSFGNSCLNDNYTIFPFQMFENYTWKCSIRLKYRSFDKTFSQGSDNSLLYFLFLHFLLFTSANVISAFNILKVCIICKCPTILNYHNRHSKQKLERSSSSFDIRTVF